ncbi:MAG: hypothetical protein LBG59_00385 [Candidatus Peribacteria bacterium]|jgi:glutamyl-tRNA reductase|nr:hypothetical protein [Candidatus Peribacteria bacterium]
MKHLFDEATQEKFEHQLTKNLQKKAEEAKEAQKSPAEKALEQRARNLIEEAAKKQLQQQGKDPNHPDYNDELKNLTDNLLHAPLFQQTLEALRNYQTTVQQLETIKDTETGKSVM